jgi:glucose/arabinose dehydrogenase
MKKTMNLTLPPLFAFVFIAMSSSSSAAQDVKGPQIALKEVVAGFERPIKMAIAPGKNDRFYIAEQAGVIKEVIQYKVDSTPFLDIRDRVTTLTSSNDERGLLGLAFHPKFAKNGRFFVNYTTKSRLRSRVSEFVIDKAGRGLAKSEKILLEVDQPYPNHNGGEVAFGPDGFLYVSLGDGGAADDPHGSGQNLTTLLGKILRIDIDSGSPYAIPSDNPKFDHTRAKKEIYAYGLRNVWRFSFDRKSGDLWAADVGQNRLEEVNIIKKGKNYGWNVMEASECFKSKGCNQTGFEKPVAEYSHADSISVTGGFVYRGQDIKKMDGTYIYGDFGSGKIWGVKPKGEAWENSLLLDSDRFISSFGEDSAGEIFVVDFRGSVLKLLEK